MAKDYYETLGVPKTATREEVKKAYKKLAKEFHPDINKSAGAEARFKEVNEAAAILGDEEKRRQYDAIGHDAFSQSQRGGGPGQQGYDYSGFRGDVDFDQIFESFFSGGGFGDIFGGGRRSGTKRGADLRYDLSLTLKEAAFGVKRRVAVKKHVTCSTCDGKGGKKLETCPTCRGHGQVQRRQQTPFGVFQTVGACPSCHGEGMIIHEPCKRCDGQGVVLERKEIEVEIPAGVEEGSRLRVAGEGEAGGKGRRSGDLYVFITVEQHELFERHGNDLLLETPISFFQAVFGGEFEVPTLDGKAKVKLPEGTQSGTVLRLREKGIPDLHGRGRGDQLVRVTIETPRKLTKKQEELMRQLAKEFGESAHPQKGLFDKLKEHLK